jgi:hypothetical protein
MSTCEGCSGSIATIEPGGNIKLKGLCMDTAGEATASGTKIVLNTCSSSTTQVWTPGNAHTLKNEASGLCLAVTSAVNGVNPDIIACTTQTTQQWRLPAM